MTVISCASAPESLADVAQKLRVLAAVASDTQRVTLHVPPDAARDLAHLIDGGGFATAVETAAALLRQSELVAREAWVDRCQKDLLRAKDDLRASLWFSVYATCAWIGAWLLWGLA